MWKKNTICLCVSLCVIIAILLILPTASVAGGAVTDTVGVYIGYFGWGEDQFVEKATYNWRELDDMFGGELTTHEHVYSYYSGARTYLVAARGFYIRDLLEHAGIDFGSISRIDFFTKDQTIGAYRSFTKSSLFDMPRYYFPNLAADAITGEVYPYDGDDIYDGATRVEPMLALEDYTEWDSVGSAFEHLYDSAMFSAASRFHLFFGQLSPTEANTSSAAKYVYKLFVTFSGTPILSADETNIDLKVGSDFRMSVNVSAEDSLLDEYVREHLAWTSSDERVVSVGSAGKLTLKTEGEAAVTASFGSSTVSVTIRVSGDAAEVDADVDSSDDASSDGKGDGGRDGDSDGGGQIVGKNDAGESGDLDERSDMDESGDLDEHLDLDEFTDTDNRDDSSFAENTRNIYMLAPEFISRKDFEEWSKSILKHDYLDGSDTGALNNSRRENKDEDAQQLVLLLNAKNDRAVVIAAVLGMCFAFGFAYGVLRFRAIRG